MKQYVLLITAACVMGLAGDARARVCAQQDGAQDAADARSVSPDKELASVNGGETRRVPSLIVPENLVQPAKVPPTPATGIAPAKPASPAAATIPILSVKGTSGNPAFDRMVAESAAANHVDPGLIFAVMRQESGSNPRARSYKGACGLMQLMPATARRFGVSNIFDPAQNIEGGAKYLRFLLDKFSDDVELTLAGYNAGEGAVVDAGYRVPRYRETQAYVRNISAKYGTSKHVQVAAASRREPSIPTALVISSQGTNRLSNNY